MNRSTLLAMVAGAVAAVLAVGVIAFAAYELGRDSVDQPALAQPREGDEPCVGINDRERRERCISHLVGGYPLGD